MPTTVTDLLGDVEPALLRAAAIGQIVVAALNLGLVRVLGWKETLSRLDLLPRQVFHVHLWFISVTLALFGALTLRFADEIAAGGDAPLSWLATAIGLFWGLRAAIQIVYYSPRHWLGHAGRTVIHVGLVLAYGGVAGVYLVAGLY